MPVRQVTVILNCKAGALVACGDPEKMLRESFAQGDLEPLFVVPHPGSLSESMNKAVKSKPDAIVVVGGDGTVACAASAMMGSDLPLGIIPCGTMNLLAKDLALPINNLDASIAIIAKGHTRNVDVGEVNSDVFLCASMLGLPARLGRTREGSRGSEQLTWVKMARAIW
jgi:diacylglycerol kinase family enzyme